MDKLIRNIDDDVFCRLKREARKKNVSLNNHINQILKTYTLCYEVTNLDEKYRNLVKDVMILYENKFDRLETVLEKTNYMLRSITYALEEVRDGI